MRSLSLTTATTTVENAALVWSFGRHHFWLHKRNQRHFWVHIQFAENYDPSTTVDDGSCILDDSGDSGCQLVYDGYGDGSVGSSDLLGLLTEFGADCLTETEFSCGNPVSYQGYDYATVLIGEQCWFAENLRSEKLRRMGTPSLHRTQAPHGWQSDHDWRHRPSTARKQRVAVH